MTGLSLGSSDDPDLQLLPEKSPPKGTLPRADLQHPSRRERRGHRRGPGRAPAGTGRDARRQPALLPGLVAVLGVPRLVEAPPGPAEGSQVCSPRLRPQPRGVGPLRPSLVLPAATPFPGRVSPWGPGVGTATSVCDTPCRAVGPMSLSGSVRPAQPWPWEPPPFLESPGPEPCQWALCVRHSGRANPWALVTSQRGRDFKINCLCHCGPHTSCHTYAVRPVGVKAEMVFLDGETRVQVDLVHQRCRSGGTPKGNLFIQKCAFVLTPLSAGHLPGPL